MKSIVVIVPWLQYASGVLTQGSAQTTTDYSCPGDNGSTATDGNGRQYALHCGSDLGGDVFDHARADNSFNDCFDFCDANSPTCTGWTYSGATNGAGSGYCYLKTGELYLSGSGEGLVAAVRVSNTSASNPSSTTSALVSSETMPSTISMSTSTRTTSSASTGTTPSSTTSPVPSYARNNGKRGLCYNNDSLTLPYAQAGTDSQVSWGYDWYYSRYSTPNDGIENPAITFIPLLFNDNPSLTDVWHEKAQAAIDAGADALMSFNEPDSCYGGSACMSVNQSVAAYRKYMQPFAGIVPLGAPAVTNGGPPYGFTWLSEFIGNCSSDCQIDFINIHWYANSYAFTYLQSYIQEAHDRFGKPIWVTEIGMNGGKDLDTEENVEAFMRKAISWLDAVPYVERYAWFIDAPGNLINDDGDGISALGVIYNNYTSPCPDWQNTDGHC